MKFRPLTEHEIAVVEKAWLRSGRSARENQTYSHMLVAYSVDNEDKFTVAIVVYTGGVLDIGGTKRITYANGDDYDQQRGRDIALSRAIRNDYTDIDLDGICEFIVPIVVQEEI